MKNHRVIVPRRGGSDVLQVIEEDLPEPKGGEVRLKVLTAGVSAYDVMLRANRFPGFPRLPYTPGADVVGVVDKLGEGVSAFEVGQQVAAGPLKKNGGYAEFLCLPAAEAVPVPSGLDPAEVVCLVVNYLTAQLAMHQVGDVHSGDRVLIQGAAGGVGTALIELGSVAGLEMYGTASKHNHELVSSLGATPIDYRNEDFVARIKNLTGDGVDVVFDPIGGAKQLWRSYRAVRKGGRLVWFGMAATSKSGTKVIPSTLLTLLLLKAIPDGKKAVTIPTVDSAWYCERLPELLDLLAAGRIKPVVAERIPLAEAARAHELLETGGHAGKVVLVASE